MFLAGPLMVLPFMAAAGEESLWRGTGAATATFVGSSAWDKLLQDDTAPMIYLATIEPWALADRS